GNPGSGSLSDIWTVDTTVPTLVAIEHLATNPRSIVVQSLDVTFSEPIEPATFDSQDVTLTRDGGANLVNSDVTVARVNDTTYRIANFNEVVGVEGVYTLTVGGAGIA